MAKRNALRDVDPVAITLCKKGANRQRIFLRKEQEGEKLLTLPAGDTPILKSADPNWTTFYCVVAEPGAEEDPGMIGEADSVDVWDSPEEIRKAAHRLLKNGGYVNLVHDGEPDAGCFIVESAVAIEDFKVGESTIRKGSWYVGIEPRPELRAAIDAGQIEAVSLEGSGIRVPLEKTGDSEKLSLWKKLGAALGVNTEALAKDSGSLKPDETLQEDEEVDEKKITELDGKVEGIAKAQSALSEAVTGLVGTVNNLVERLDASNKKGEGDDNKEPSPSDLKKSLDEATTLLTDVAGRLDTVEQGITALADPGSTQGNKDDLKKTGSEYELAGIL